MGKWSKYERKYSADWEKESEFKYWIQEVATDSTKAFCKYCRCELRTHRSDLNAHK